ncbi:trypsin-like peptidase domain-containing protein [Candidatus Azambacteria bacterium]|nr:trypsin-like peptidase domain-containing protein [Candidatus Azambacteria bacterium]
MAKKSPLVEAVKKVTPAVVSIIITKNHPQSDVPPSMDPFFPFGYDPFYPFGPEHPKQPRPEGPMKIGGGSGFLIDPDGLVLTNRHVVMDADAEYTVVLSSDQKYPATVVAHDPINDVAVLKIPASGLPTIKLGDSSKLELGEEVIAVGNALGQFQNTVSRGIVSGLSRYITASSGLEGKAEQLRGLIQTDAAINPGNSGGPLLNLDGEAIGINAAIVFGAENIGFAIPINAAKKDLADIAKFGRIRQPSLGVRYILVDEELQKRYKLPISSGALVIREARLCGDSRERRRSGGRERKRRHFGMQWAKNYRENFPPRHCPKIEDRG